MKNLLTGFIIGAGVVAALMYFVRRGTPASEYAGTVVHGTDLAVHDLRAGVGEPAVAVPGRDAAEVGSSRTTPNPRSTADVAVASATAGEVSAPTASAALELPGGALADVASEQAPLKELLNAFRVECQFGPGAGGQWPNGNLSPHTAVWQGGSITFDTVDLATGKARFKNYSGLTRTPDGELEVRAIATDTGLHFTVIKPDGELMMATVYAALDSQHKHRAAISFHGTNLDHESAQFYGNCTL